MSGAKQSEASRLKKCRNGGIGRRAGFRCLWSQDRVGSSPISCIVFFALRIKNWSGGPIRIALMGSVKTFRQGLFISMRRRCADGERKTDESQTV